MSLLTHVAEYLATTRASEAIASRDWIVPMFQTIHIVAIGLVFSTGLILALSSWNLLSVGWSPARWVGRLSGWFWLGLVVLLVSGSVLIVGEPTRSLLNLMFQLKMLMLAGALAATMGMFARLRRADPGAADGARGSEATTAADGTSRVYALIALVLWLGIITTGRWIAYYTPY